MTNLEQLTIVRHGESVLNRKSLEQTGDHLFRDFLIEYDADWQSANSVDLAEELYQRDRYELEDEAAPLSMRGVMQVARTATAMHERLSQASRIYVSPYKRTQDTAVIISKLIPEIAGLELTEDERLSEQNRGLQSAYRNWRVFEVLNPSEKIIKDELGLFKYRAPNGESLEDVRDRTESFIADLNETADSKPLIITHFWPILAMRDIIDGPIMHQASVDQANLDLPSNAGVTLFENMDAKLRLVESVTANDNG